MTDPPDVSPDLFAWVRARLLERFLVFADHPDAPTTTTTTQEKS